MHNENQIPMAGLERPQSPLKLFLIEDSAAIRERLLEEIASIRKTEFVGCAGTASDALEQLSKLECDVIVLDLNLERGSGFEVLKSVRAKHAQRPKVIVFTSYAYPFYRHLTMEMGANFFLDKATDFKLLLHIIEGLPAADDAAPN